MSINIVEVTWKGKLKEAFPDPNAYSSFMGNFSTATGCVPRPTLPPPHNAIPCVLGRKQTVDTENLIPHSLSSRTNDNSAVTLVMMLLGRSIFQKYGWGVAALITPVTLLATGVAFFSLIIFNGPSIYASLRLFSFFFFFFLFLFSSFFFF